MKTIDRIAQFAGAMVIVGAALFVGYGLHTQHPDVPVLSGVYIHR